MHGPSCCVQPLGLKGVERQQVEGRVAQGFLKDFSKKGGGGGNHLMPPTYQETVPVQLARIRLWKVFLNSFLLQQLSLCCCLYFKTTLL